MFKRNFILLGMIIFLLMFSSSFALAIEFSADSIYKGGGKTMKSKMYMKNDRYRTEGGAAEGMGIIITRLDKKVIWMIQPKQKMYMEMPFKSDPKDYKGKDVKGEIKRELVGSETIDGHPAKKYKVTYKTGSKVGSIYQWVATDIDFPIKTEAVDGKWSQEYKNIKVGNVSNSLFEVPAGYKKMNMPTMPKTGK